MPSSVAMPETLYCLAGASPETVTVSPTLKPYFFDVPRSSATSSAVFGGPPSTVLERWKIFSVDAETSSVGGPLEVIGLPLLVEQRAVGADAALGDVDARRRLDLVERRGRHRRRRREVGLDRLVRLDLDVDALLRALEEVRERRVDRVGEDERADDEGDADHDGERPSGPSAACASAGP